MSAVEILGVMSIPAMVAWLWAAILPKHSALAYKLITFALIFSFIVSAVAAVYGVWWLSWHVCY